MFACSPSILSCYSGFLLQPETNYWGDRRIGYSKLTTHVGVRVSGVFLYMCWLCMEEVTGVPCLSPEDPRHGSQILSAALWNPLCATWLDKASLLFSLSLSLSALDLSLQKLDVLAGSSSGVNSSRTGLNL